MTIREPQNADGMHKQGQHLAFGVELDDRKYRLRLARYKALAEAIAAFVRERNSSGRLALLDIGVGRGRSMFYVEAEGVADRIEWIGSDIEERRVADLLATRKWAGAVQADLEKGLPFDAARFDIVICEQVLEHLADPAKALAEIARVLRPGGLLILGVPSFPWGLSHLRRLYVLITSRWLGMKHHHVQSFDSRSIRRLVSARSEFAIQQCYGCRIISGGLLGPLEDHFGWYRFNRWLGRALPGLCTELQMLAIRAGAPKSIAERTD